MKNVIIKSLIVIVCFYYHSNAACLTVTGDTLNNGMFYTFGISNKSLDINDSTAKVYKSLGVTGIESYVTWETCERDSEGHWDWSAWDKTVKVLMDNNLKWVPFLILGPAYSTPNWFRAGTDHFPCRCLEHGIASKVESLWNPNLPKRVDIFISEFSKRYKETGVIESVILGIQGDYGEAVYTVTGGGWTFKIPGEYHNHAGYWCDDPYALADFRKFIQKRYKGIAKLNKLWGTEFNDFNKVDFPGRKDELKAFEEKVINGVPQARRRWVDFTDWYRGCMTDWSDWWISKTREYFPNTPVYLCTGGDAQPKHGSNFAEQSRVAAKHGAGVRITNEGSDYAKNFSVTRWVASAGKHYGAYFGFEPASKEDEKGIIARIYNATASGANQLHDYAMNVKTKEQMKVQQMHLKYLFNVAKPIVPIAVRYPNISWTMNWGAYGRPLEKFSQFREYTDFDYVDETMLRTGALNHIRILVIITGEVMEPSDAKLITDWAKKGGRVIVMDVPKFESVEGTPETENILFGNNGSDNHVIGKGWIVRVNGWSNLSRTLGITMSELRLPICDLAVDGVFTTQIGKDRWLFLNTTDKASIARFVLLTGNYSTPVEPGTITEVDMNKVLGK